MVQRVVNDETAPSGSSASDKAEVNPKLAELQAEWLVCIGEGLELARKAGLTRGWLARARRLLEALPAALGEYAAARLRLERNIPDYLEAGEHGAVQTELRLLRGLVG